jgi:hypothetical protein
LLESYSFLRLSSNPKQEKIVVRESWITVRSRPGRYSVYIDASARGKRK